LLHCALSFAQSAPPEEVVVEGEARREVGEGSASVTVVEVDDRLPVGADLADAVGTASGAVVRRLGGAGNHAAVSLRGSSMRQVEVYLDGLPLNPGGGSVVNLTEWPLQSFERIEVYRGNAPPSFGSAPMGGVLNLVTPMTEAPATVSAGAGAFGTYAASTAAGMGLGKGGTLWGSAGASSTRGNFEAFDDNGTLYNTADDRVVKRQNNGTQQGNALLRWRVGGGRFRLSVLDAARVRREGLAGPIESPAEEVSLSTWRHLAAVKLEGRTSASRWSARGWRRDRSESYQDLDGELGTGAQHTTDRFETTGLLVDGSLLLAPYWVPSATVQVHADRYHHTDRRSGEMDPVRTRYATAATLSSEFWAFSDALYLSPTVRAEMLDSRALDTNQATLWAAQPRLGLAWKPGSSSGLSVRFNAGRYLRVPDLTELFGDRGALIGNPDLVPETGVQWDLGVRLEKPDWGAEGLSLDMCAFENHARDSIVSIQNSQRTSVPVNVGRARTRGVEASLSLWAVPWLDSQSMLTWMEPQNLTARSDVESNRLPGLPVWDARQSTTLVWGERLRLGHTFDYAAGMFRDATNFFLDPPRALHGVFARWTAGPFVVEAGVSNVADRRTAWVDRNPLSVRDDVEVLQPVTDYMGYPLPGRSWRLALRWLEPGRRS